MAYAIYELEPIGKDGALEANGTIHWYCDKPCSLAGRLDYKGDLAEGVDNDCVDGMRCEWCTSPLATAAAPKEERLGARDPRNERPSVDEDEEGEGC